MAGLATDKKTGNRRILFKGIDGKRAAIYLGKVPLDFAKDFRRHVGKIMVAIQTGEAIESSTAKWIAALSDDYHGKLVQHGLVRERKANQVDVATLDAFLQSYIEGRTDLKPRTKFALGLVRNDLVNYFGATRRLDDIAPGDADEFRLSLKSRLGENTIRRTCGRAKQFFRAAVRKRLIAESPFADMKKTSVGENEDRFFFVTREMATAVLAACPDNEWRLIFALSRYGGLRCPSEHLLLKWSEIDWERNRMRVLSPKTEHHDGKAWRFVPLFPELRTHLEAMWDEVTSAEGFDPKKARLSEQPIITRYRSPNANLRTQFERIIKRAGLIPWQKLFQNLRSTRQTELQESFPSHVVCSWLGNSPKIANKHYLQVTDEHFARAMKEPINEPVKATLNPTLQGTEPDGMGATEEMELCEIAGFSGEFAVDQLPRQEANIQAESSGNSQKTDPDNAKSDARRPDPSPALPPSPAGDATAELLAVCHDAKQLLELMWGHWPGTIAINARALSDKIDAVLGRVSVPRPDDEPLGDECDFCTREPLAVGKHCPSCGRLSCAPPTSDHP